MARAALPTLLAQLVIPLGGDLPAAPVPIAEALLVHDGLVLEDVLYRLSDSGGGSAGQTQGDLLLDGATLYPVGILWILLNAAREALSLRRKRHR